LVHRVNNFFSDFDRLRSHYDSADFDGLVSPVDGVKYPGIAAVPEWAQEEVRQQVGIPSYLFSRISPKGTRAPHRAHNDDAMGRWTMIIYLNRPEHCEGGTSIVQHKETGIYRGPCSHEDVLVWKKDTNNSNKWRVIKMMPMESNTAVIYPSTLFHQSEPDGGFGDVPRNARLVMVGFFDEIKIR
jgi:hypothetical protein